MFIQPISINPIVGISKFKANTQKYLDMLNETKQPIIILQDTKPVAILTPILETPELTKEEKQTLMEKTKLEINAIMKGKNKDKKFTNEELDKYTS
jgi:prevent-host-death family protein